MDAGETIALGNARDIDAPVEVSTKAHSTLRHTLVLGSLTALGALGIDTYLPAFPRIAHSLGVTEGRVQMSLVSYFVALAAGQMVYGPLSDRFGRKIPLLVGLLLFTVASIGAALAFDINTLIVMRFIQGIGACAGMVLPRAVVRDLRSGDEAARLFALMILVLGVSPICAPLLGTLLTTYLPWQALFWFLAFFGLLCFISVARLMEETLPPSRRTVGGIAENFHTFPRLLTDSRFLVPTLIGAFSQAAIFAYLPASPFIYITLHHVPPKLYSVLFATNAIGLIGLAQVNVNLLRRFGAPRLLRFSTAIQSLATLGLLAAICLHADSLLLTGICFFAMVGVQGMIGPTTTMLALEPYPEVAGAASALSGTVQFAAGAIAGALVSALFNGTALPFALVVSGCALSGLSLAFFGRQPMPSTVNPQLAGMSH